jgi:hypothetical protein
MQENWVDRDQIAGSSQFGGERIGARQAKISRQPEAFADRESDPHQPRVAAGIADDETVITKAGHPAAFSRNSHRFGKSRTPPLDQRNERRHLERRIGSQTGSTPHLPHPIQASPPK